MNLECKTTTKKHQYGHLPPISQTIQGRWARHVWSKDELISDVLLLTPTHGHTSVGRPGRAYMRTQDGPFRRDGWGERKSWKPVWSAWLDDDDDDNDDDDRFMCVCVLIYIYIYVCVCVCMWWWWYMNVYVCDDDDDDVCVCVCVCVCDIIFNYIKTSFCQFIQ